MNERPLRLNQEQRDSGDRYNHAVLVIAASGAEMPYYHSLRNCMRGESFGKTCIGDVRERIGLLNAEIALLDCGVHVSTGLRALMTIKQANPRVPVVFLTDAGSEETAVKAFRAGARDYFKKPVIVVQVAAVIRGLLNARRSSWEQRSPFERSCAEIPALQAGMAPAEQPDSVARAVDYIEQNLDGSITLNKLAGAACLSKFHFCRIFRDYVGMNPMQFISNARIERAKILLELRRMPISSIANTTGYRDISTFNRQFKLQTGMSPSEYRISRKVLSASSPHRIENPKGHRVGKILQKQQYLQKEQQSLQRL